MRQAFQDSDGLELTPWASRALLELALPTHGRIVESYREQCGGDWAILADDGYYLRYFAWHLLHLDHVTELTENLDWLMRAGRDAPGWHNVLPGSVGLGYLDSADQALTLEYFASAWPPGAFFGQTSRLGMSGTRRMAEARLALRHGATVRWILVTGTRTESLDPWLRTLSECVGRELARWGYGLLTDGAPGVVWTTERAYSAQLKTNDFPPGTGVRDAAQFANYTEEPPRQGSVQPDENAWNEALAENADAVVVIGGREDTSEILQMVQMNLRLLATGRMVPVIPIIPNEGEGDAKTSPQPSPDAWAALGKKPESRADCYAMARALITLLPENPSQQESSVRS